MKRILDIYRHAGFYPYNPALGQVIQSDAAGNNPDRAFIAHLNYTALQMAAAKADGAVDGQAASASEIVTVLAEDMIAQPAYARNAVVTVGGTAGSIKAAPITLNGLDINGDAISEDFTPVVDTAATLTGTKAFASYTSIVIPIQDGAGVTVDLGWGQLVGLPYKRAHHASIATFNDNVLDTAPVFTASATVIALNTVDFEGSLDGSVMDLYLLV